MISLEQIESWIAAGESETVEWKATTGERKSAMQTVCAMLNHRGGRVVFGVVSGRPVGQDVSERTMEEVAEETRQIEPPVLPTIDRVPGPDGRSLIVLTVTQGQVRPYSYKGKAYYRVGNTTQIMSRDQYNQLLFERLHGEQRWENRQADGWSVADLDIAELTRTIEEAVRRSRAEDPGTRNPEDLLRGLGLIRDGRILRAAAVLFGRSERLEAEFPQCLLRVARFKGDDRTEFLDNRQFHGNIFDLLLRAERFLRESLPVAGRVVPGLFDRVDDPLYPPIALREALANAFCHRDYSIGGGSVAVAIYDGRMEVTSSGTLHFGITAEALFEPHESLPWNPLIARVLYRRGIIEAWGRGTLKIAELTERAGLPRPQIIDAGGSVTVAFRPTWYVPPQRVARDLTETQRAILEQLARAPYGAALRRIRSALSGEKLQDWELKADLALLRQLGLVETRGHARGARWYLVGEAHPQRR